MQSTFTNLRKGSPSPWFSANSFGPWRVPIRGPWKVPWVQGAKVQNPSCALDSSHQPLEGKAGTAATVELGVRLKDGQRARFSLEHQLEGCCLHLPARQPGHNWKTMGDGTSGRCQRNTKTLVLGMGGCPKPSLFHGPNCLENTDLL